MLLLPPGEVSSPPCPAVKTLDVKKMADADDRPPGGGALLVAPEERAELRRLAGAAGEPDAAAAGEVPRGAAARLARFQALVRAREAHPPRGLGPEGGLSGGEGPGVPRPPPAAPAPAPAGGGVDADRGPPPAFPGHPGGGPSD